MNESLLISFEEAGRLLGGLHPKHSAPAKGWHWRTLRTLQVSGGE